MRDSIRKSINHTIRDLNKSGLVAGATVENFESLCLAKFKNYSSKNNSYKKK